MERCDMTNPGLCNMDSNSSVNSAYYWRRHSGLTPTENTGPMFDADGNPYGIAISLSMWKKICYKPFI